MSRPRRRRRRGRTTREGKAFVFVTIGVGVAAVNTGNNLLYLMLGLMLSLLLLSMVLSEIALMRLDVQRFFPRRAFVGESALVEVGLTNSKRWIPSYSLDVEDRASKTRAVGRCFFLKVGALARRSATYRWTPTKRGPLTTSGFIVSTRYPFGLVEKSHFYTDASELLVYPALYPVPYRSAFSGFERAEESSEKAGPGTELGGLRYYAHGDDARSIHWRRTASLGQVVTRERERDHARRLTLSLDNRRTDAQGWDDAFEQAISAAASMAASALQNGATVDVVTHSGASAVVAPGSSPDPIWSFLALLEPTEQTAEPLEISTRPGTGFVQAVPLADPGIQDSP